MRGGTGTGAGLPIALVLGHRFSSLDVEEAGLAGLARVVDANTLDDAGVHAALGSARVVLLGTRARLDAGMVEAMHNCQAIVRYGIGVDNVAVEQATAQGILVVNVPEYCIDEVSDHAVALILAANRRLIVGHRAAQAGEWGTSIMQGTARLATQVAGVVGFGRIGQEVARKLLPMVARVLVYDPFVPAEAVRDHGAYPSDLDGLLATSDYVTLHCPLTPNTRHLIDSAALGKTKRGAWIVNTSRGEIVDQPALIAALEAGRIGGAALDVLAQEPPPLDLPLLHVSNAIVTPHVAWYSSHAVHDLQRLAVEEARAVLLGETPRWVVNR